MAKPEGCGRGGVWAQSCGRARHLLSEVVVLSDPEGESECLVKKVVQAEAEMRLMAQKNAVSPTSVPCVHSPIHSCAPRGAARGITA